MDHVTKTETTNKISPFREALKNYQEKANPMHNSPVNASMFNRITKD
jgi:hypothetical protein